jgi:hypothetical protein
MSHGIFHKPKPLKTAPIALAYDADTIRFIYKYKVKFPKDLFKESPGSLRAAVSANAIPPLKAVLALIMIRRHPNLLSDAKLLYIGYVAGEITYTQMTANDPFALEYLYNLVGADPTS